MSRQPNQPEAQEPPPVNDWESLKTVATADAANGWQWDLGLVFVVYVVLRAIGAVGAALRGSPDVVDARRTIISDRHDREGT